MICTLCDAPHEVAEPTEPETRARVTPRQLKILTEDIKDPLKRAHVARVVYAAGELTWFELYHVANRTEHETDTWPSALLERLSAYTYDGLVKYAVKQQRAIARFQAHVSRCIEHHERRPSCAEGDHDVWNFFSDFADLPGRRRSSGGSIARSCARSSFERLPPLIAVPGLVVGPASLVFVAAVEGAWHQFRLVARPGARSSP